MTTNINKDLLEELLAKAETREAQPTNPVGRVYGR